MRNIPKTKLTQLYVTQPDTLVNFLLSKMGGMSRNSICLMLGHRQVSVDGVIQTRFDYQLQEGNVIQITTGVVAKELTHPKLKIIYEDDYLIVVEKKPGLLTVATHPDSHEVTCFSILKNYVRQKNARAGIYVVHRLDRETSGLLVFAKSQDLQHYMRDYWRELVTKRTYIAVAEGFFEQKEGRIVTWLTEDDETRMVYSSPVDDGGKMAVTNYTVLKETELPAKTPGEEGKRYSLVELNLETGRKNQIRVHLTGMGHPIAGDRKYGNGDNTAIDRLALHARILEFIHPVTEQTVHFETVIPYEFSRIFK